MARFNEGVIYTNDKCVGCNKCISVCMSFGANVSSHRNNEQRIDVSKKCINCGQCIHICSHGAREYRDDLDAFIKDIDAGEDISVLVDPSFYILYKDKAPKVFGFLKSLGVKNIYDVAYGAEISMYCHARYLKERQKKGHEVRQFIANNCAAINNYIECINPGLMPYVIPVHSPVMCTAIYAKKYLKDNSKFMSLSSCVSQTDELKSADNGREISYCVTYQTLFGFMKKRGCGFDTADSDLKAEGLGNIIAYPGGFLEGVALFFPREEVFTNYSGTSDSNIEKLKMVLEKAKAPHSLMITLSACESGCVGGTGISKADLANINTMPQYREIRTESFKIARSCSNTEEYYAYYEDKFKDIELLDFAKAMMDRYKQPYDVPEDVIQDIFDTMHKTTEIKQNINCGSCGYKTCRELVKAVCNGYARIQDCVHFMNDDLKYTALRDFMSGIYNRSGFEKRAREILNENPDKNYVVLVGNVNKLKLVNNLYGVSTGDKVLTYISRKIAERMADDETCARFGGGSFAVFIEDRPERVKEFMDCQSFDADHIGVFFPITIRYGMYRITDHTLNLSRVVNICTYAADTATNRTKNTYIEFDDSMRKDMQVETDITLEMRDALEKGEFVLYLQPQYNHRTGKMVGAETLSRWIKKDGSIVSPALFIPIFEKNGFIKEYDKYVWESAFKIVKDWEDKNLPIVPISINVSRISLENDEIIETIKELDNKYKVDKAHLYFEITESAYMENQEDITKRILGLKEIGYRIAMDDFGSGYSSLNSLKDIPIDILKLDMGFLRGGTNVEKGNEIIAHMVDMAKAISLKMVAEGVETKEQADFLTDRGCDVIQGYYYARPMPIEDFEKKVVTEM